jgi:ADP-heptose:LPS heptosyltransferase
MDNPSATSSMLMAAIAPQFSVGIEKDNSSSYNVRVPLIDRSQFHIARRIAELLRPFGIDPNAISLQPVLKPTTALKVAGRVGFNLSAGVYDRYVPKEKNIELVKGILGYSDVHEVVVFTHPNDRSLGESIIHESGDERVRLAPITKTFKEFAGEIATCEILVTPDTSAVHVASAYSVPVITMLLPQPVLHYWTPIGVDFEMIVHGPTLETIPTTEVLTAFARLHERIEHSEISRSAEYVA